MSDIKDSIELKTVLGLAEELAGRPKAIRPEFVLLALLEWPGAAFERVLDMSGIDILGLIADVRRIASQPPTRVPNEPSPSAVVDLALDAARAEARGMHSSAVFPEHLLLGLLTNTGGPLRKAFRERGASPARIKDVIVTLSAKGSREQERSVKEKPPTIAQLREAMREAGIRDDALALVVDLDVLPPALVAEFMAALDALHRAWGGAGLEIESDQVGVGATSREVFG